MRETKTHFGHKTDMKKITGYFTKGELILWGASVLFITVSFLLFDRENLLALAASLTGATSLILCAKGNPIGQLLIVIFSIMYAVISWSFRYYGEMITYLGMTAPMAIISLISWLKNPYNGNRSEVRVNRLKKGEKCFIPILAAAVTLVFYFILKAFNTANLLPSVISVTTSFTAAYLTFRRTPFYAVFYAANDIVLIILWVLACMEDISYLSVVICFLMFLVNDIYGFISWSEMEKRQQG